MPFTLLFRCKNMNKVIFSLVTATFLAIASGASAATMYGDNNCQPVYGGGETCVTQGKVTINKTVKNPTSNSFVDNLTINDPRYSTNSTVTFRIVVTNTGNASISEINVEDIFPSFVEYKSGPGSFDKTTKKLSFKILNLNAGESRTYTITGQTAETSALPAKENVTCVVNQVVATEKNNVSKDNSQFCIEKTTTTSKGGLPVKPAPKLTQTPSTGPEMLALIGLIPTGIGGFLLRRKASK